MKHPPARLHGLFAFQLVANGRAFRATIEIKEPGLELREVRDQICEVWGQHFASSESIPLHTIECWSWKPVEQRPPDTLPTGRSPILIWESVPL